jgi:hypothetical protein
MLPLENRLTWRGEKNVEKQMLNLYISIVW